MHSAPENPGHAWVVVSTSSYTGVELLVDLIIADIRSQISLALSAGAVIESILVIGRGGFDLRLFFPMLLFVHRIKAVIGFG